MVASFSVSSAYFNPRTHIECDITVFGDCTSLFDFNPRTHIECDQLSPVELYELFISIHALT